MKICIAAEERKRIQHFDRQFKERSSNRYKIPLRKHHQGTSLRVDQQVTTDLNAILSTWEEHFKSLSTVSEDMFPALSCVKEQIMPMMTASFENCDSLLDVPFCAEEIDAVLRKLKSSRSAGHDMLQAEHLKYGGPILRRWIEQICNSIADLESVPDSLKTGIIIPVYIGGGKDPLDTNSYRGITLTSVLAKVLESLLLTRLLTHLSERGIPHLNQTAYRKRVSCAEAIFSTLEVISQHSQKNEKMYMCFFDLQKAFDSVLYPILFKRVYDSGVNGKAWRLICSWYNQPKSMVRVSGHLTPLFTLERGVLQGSVLSPILFLLVMDPLLQTLENKNLGPNIYGTYVGAFAHADDICTVTSSTFTLQQQINTVQSFAKENGLALNPTKCEVLLVSSSKSVSSAPVGILGSQALTTQHHAKCLGYWWSWDLSAAKAIDEAIKRARRAFFAFGAIGAFNGKLNPISSRTIFDVCVIPILLYGSENWILTTPLLDRLEAFQGEIGRRILKLSKFHSLLSTRLALRWPSVAARIFIQKLNLLFKINSEEDSIGCHIFSKLAAKDPQSLRIIQECQYLEDRVECQGATDNILNSETSLKEVKNRILKVDWENCITEASQHSSTALAASISSSTSWLKLWDMALDYGPRGTAAMQALYRTLTRPRLDQNTCAICGDRLETSYFDHYTIHHTPIHSPEIIIDSLVEESREMFDYAHHFL